MSLFLIYCCRLDVGWYRWKRVEVAAADDSLLPPPTRAIESPVEEKKTNFISLWTSPWVAERVDGCATEAKWAREWHAYVGVKSVFTKYLPYTCKTELASAHVVWFWHRPYAIPNNVTWLWYFCEVWKAEHSWFVTESIILSMCNSMLNKCLYYDLLNFNECIIQRKIYKYIQLRDS